MGYRNSWNCWKVRSQVFLRFLKTSNKSQNLCFRNFPSSKRNMSLEFLEPIMDILRTKDPTPGPALETACLKSLVHLGQYLQVNCVFLVIKKTQGSRF